MVEYVRLTPRATGTILAALAMITGGCSSVETSSVGGVALDGAAYSDVALGVVPLGDAGVCLPGDVETYRADAYHPAAGAWQGVCNAQGSVDPIPLYYDSCLGPGATPGACAAFKANKQFAACLACILAPAGAGHYGPLVDHGSVITANVAGCIELTDPGGLLCAKAQQALTGCEVAACAANCPVRDAQGRAAYAACAAATDAAGCHSYSTAASCVDAERDAGLAALCLTASFADFYGPVVRLFCGSPPPSSDAGSDALPAPADASSEGGSSSSSDAAGDAPSDGSSDASKD